MGIFDKEAETSTQAGGTMKPGKGAMVPADKFVALVTPFIEFTQDSEPEALSLEETLTKHFGDPVVDDFGSKWTVATQPNGDSGREFRLTVVKTKRDGSWNVDVRTWYSA